MDTSSTSRFRPNEWITTCGHDVRVACRQFRRAPAFVAATVLTLGLGIGATTAIFSVVNGVLLRPLPYRQSDRIVQLWEVNQGGNTMQLSDPNFDDVRARTRIFDGLAEFDGTSVASVSGAISPMRASLTHVSHDFFDVLGMEPVLGRTFTPEEEREGGAPAVVVSWGFWQRVLGGSRDALERRLVIGDRTYTLVGVIGPGIDFPAGTDLWASREILGRLPSRTAHNWQVIGRLRPGVRLDQAQQDLTSLAHALAAQWGSQTMMANAVLVPLREQLVGSVRLTLLVLLAASVVLLLIACANVANLLVARLTARQGELALRLALGAARARLLQQCLAESGLLALAGGAIGVAMAVVATKALLALDPGRLPRTGEVRVDARVLLLALGVSLATAVGLALISVWRAVGGELRDALSVSQRTMSGAGSSTRIRGALVVAQVAMTLVLLVSAGLLARSFITLLKVDPGFRAERAVVLDLSVDAEADLVDVPGSAHHSSAEAERTAFYRELITRLGGVPGVTTVGAINAIPLATEGKSNGTFIELTSPDERITFDEMQQLSRDHGRTGQAEFRVASGGYFAAMHIPLLEGRTFDDRDAPDGVNVALVSRSLARAKWPGQSPIGKWIQFGNMDGDLRPFIIVGVVGDVREAALDVQPKPTFYANYLQRQVSTTRMNIVLAGPGDPASITASARAMVGELRPDVPPRFRTIESIVASSVAGRRFVLLLVGVFGGAALVLAATGLYSVISYMVAQRVHELGIRVALGGPAHEIVGLVMREGGALAAVGMAIGAVSAVVVAQLLRGLLYGISATDPVAFSAMGLVVIVVALVACWVPARRASRADVMEVLRS